MGLVIVVMVVMMMAMMVSMVAAATHPHAVCLRPAQYSHPTSWLWSFCTAGLGF